MSDPLHVVTVGYDSPLLTEREAFVVHEETDAGAATATLETAQVDIVVTAAYCWEGIRSTLQDRFPQIPVVVYDTTDAVAVDEITDEADAYVPREGGESLLAARLPAETADRAEAAAAIEASSLRFQSLAKSVGLGILSIDPDSVIQFANPAMEELLGWSPAELEGESLGLVIPDRLRTQHFEGLQEYLETGERHLDWSGVDLPAEHADGHEMTVTVSFGEFEYLGNHYFTGVITPAGVDDELVEELSAVYGRLQEALVEVDDEELTAAVEDLGDLVEGMGA